MPRDAAALLELARGIAGDNTPLVANVAIVATPADTETTLVNPLVAFVAVETAVAPPADDVETAIIRRDISDKSDKSWRRLWDGADPNRRCYTCGAKPAHRYPDGSPAYSCHATSRIPHVAVGPDE